MRPDAESGEEQMVERGRGSSRGHPRVRMQGAAANSGRQWRAQIPTALPLVPKGPGAASPAHGFSSPNTVGINSETVGWMCMVRIRVV
jgi:hypothetical protein